MLLQIFWTLTIGFVLIFGFGWDKRESLEKAVVSYIRIYGGYIVFMLLWFIWMVEL